MTQVTLTDWKSSKSGYVGAEMHLQLGGYFDTTHYFDTDALAWMRHDLTWPPTQAAIVNIRPEGCTTKLVMGLKELETAREHFRECVAIFNWMVDKGFAKLPEREEYRIEGKLLPSVTYIIQHVIAKPGLLNWYAKMAKEGKDPLAERDKAAATGSSWHKTILFFLQGKPVDMANAPQEQKDMLINFENWSRKVKLNPLMLETRVANLDIGWAGTFDCLAEASLEE